jgi:hypothetical protein
VDATRLIRQSFLTGMREGKKPELDVYAGRDAALSILLANQVLEEGRVIKF